MGTPTGFSPVGRVLFPITPARHIKLSAYTGQLLGVNQKAPRRFQRREFRSREGRRLDGIAQSTRVDSGYRVLGDPDDSAAGEPDIHHDPIHERMSRALRKDDEIVYDGARNIAFP